MLQGDNYDMNILQQIIEAHYYQNSMFHLEQLIIKSINVLSKEFLSQLTPHSLHQNQNKEGSNCMKQDNTSQLSNPKETNANQSFTYVSAQSTSCIIDKIPDVNKEYEEEEENVKDNSIGKLLLQKKIKRPKIICTDCPHHDAKHYAKVFNNIMYFLNRKCAPIAIIQEEETKNLGIVIIDLKHIMLWDYVKIAIN